MQSKRFVVRKNTLPYIHQWAVLDLDTGNKVGEYKTQQQAAKACSMFEKHGITNQNQAAPVKFENAWDAINKRIQKPDGDPLPKLPKHSNKRRVELGE